MSEIVTQLCNRLDLLHFRFQELLDSLDNQSSKEVGNELNLGDSKNEQTSY